jgi:hypothetical protein
MKSFLEGDEVRELLNGLDLLGRGRVAIAIARTNAGMRTHLRSRQI